MLFLKQKLHHCRKDRFVKKDYDDDIKKTTNRKLIYFGFTHINVS